MSRKKAFYSLLCTLAGSALFASVLYLGYVTWRTHTLYTHTKSELYGGWSSPLHRNDAELGFAPIPGASGLQLFPRGVSIPVRYDENGFRVPVAPSDEAGRGGAVLLALGCSFTYGEAILAEETFALKVGRGLGATVKNAGVFGYGLPQMLTQAKRLVPGIKPDYLLVQYSPWYFERSTYPFAPTAFGKIPVPYFSARGALDIQPPPFESVVIQLPVAPYKQTEKGFTDFLSFLVSVGFPLFSHDDAHMCGFAVRKLFSRVPEPAIDQQALISSVYGEFSRIARESGSRLVIVALARTSDPLDLPLDSFPEDALVVNAQDALLRKLNQATEENYRATYNHWIGHPPRLVDIHPNARAHQIIADEILSRIRAENRRRD